jgi:hypothetical protein
MQSVWHTCNNVPFAFSSSLPVAPLSLVWLCAAASPVVRQEHASIALCYYIYGFSSYPMLLLSACCAGSLRGNCEVASCRCHTFHPDTPAVTNTWRVAADLHNGLGIGCYCCCDVAQAREYSSHFVAVTRSLTLPQLRVQVASGCQQLVRWLGPGVRRVTGGPGVRQVVAPPPALVSNAAAATWHTTPV